MALFPGARVGGRFRARRSREVIAGLDEQVPGMADRLLGAGPTIREHLNIFVDGERAALATPVGADAVVHVIPAVSGG